MQSTFLKVLTVKVSDNQFKAKTTNKNSHVSRTKISTSTHQAFKTCLTVRENHDLMQCQNKSYREIV